MASRIKRTGVTGSMLVAMANRGGAMTADRSGFPPSRVFLPYRRRGLVQLHRECGLGRCNYNVWRLTPKGWEASGVTPPIPTDV